MPYASDTTYSLSTGLTRLGKCLAILGMSVAGLSIIGRLLDVDILKSFFPGAVPAKPGTALGMLLVGTALLLKTAWQPAASRNLLAWILAACSLLLGISVLLDPVLVVPIRLDQMLFSGQIMSAHAALILILLALALLFWDSPARFSPYFTQALAMTVHSLCLLVFIFYVVGMRDWFGFAGSLRLSFNAMVAFALLALAMLFARPDRGVVAILASPGPGGVIARRLLPAALVLPILLGWLRMFGERLGYYPSEFGIGLMILMSIFLLSGIVYATALKIERVHHARELAERRVSEIQENTPDALVVVNEDGNIVLVNKKTEQLFGYGRDELMGKSIEELVSVPNRPRLVELRAEFLQHIQTSPTPELLDIHGLHKNGQSLPLEISLSPVSIGDKLLVSAAIRDIGRRVRAEETIRHFQHVVNNMPSGLTVWKADPGRRNKLCLVSANPSASRVLQFDLQTVVDETMEDIFPALVSETISVIEQVIPTGQATNYEEVYFGSDSMPHRWWSYRAFPLPREHVGVIFEDISERKKTEELIRNLNVELSERVRERTAELAESNRSLLEKNQENEMFVYSVSHDLRSPLVNLQGFSQELDTATKSLRKLMENDEVPANIRTQCVQIIDRDLGESLHFIQTGVLRLSGIIDAMLRLSRAGRVDFQFKRVPVHHIVNQIVEAMKGSIENTDATVTVRDLPPAWADRAALEQVFANLIGNALKYLDPQRAGMIEIGWQPVPDDPSGRRGRYYVKDNGLGIPAKYQHKVFQAFERVHSDIAGGEGIGLAIVKRIIERHHGVITLQSEPGEGTTVFVELPDRGSMESMEPLALQSKPT